PRSLELSDDGFGYRWLVLVDPDLPELVTQVHMASSTLEEHGYGPQLLCSVFGFAPRAGGHGPSPAYLVYLYKRGSFYPFCPTGPDRRDNQAELQLKAVLGEDLKLEADLSRWFPLWGLPV
ncbi:MAG TPA: hypothetical protein VKY15_04125, partial [Acidimicrobiales bacterium]|nr:hypothetical protein [Acidimicrobiales bacterium]